MYSELRDQVGGDVCASPLMSERSRRKVGGYFAQTTEDRRCWGKLVLLWYPTHPKRTPPTPEPP